METKGIITFCHFNIDQHWHNQMRRAVASQVPAALGTEVTVCQDAACASLLSPKHNREAIYHYSAPNMFPYIRQVLHHIFVPPFQQQVWNVTLVFTATGFCWCSSSKAFVLQKPVVQQRRHEKNAPRLCQGRCLYWIGCCWQKSKV